MDDDKTLALLFFCGGGGEFHGELRQQFNRQLNIISFNDYGNCLLLARQTPTG